MSTQAVYLCGVHKDYCVGSTLKETNATLGNRKGHKTPREAKRCYVKYMRSLGYEQSGGNLLIKEGEPAVMMSRERLFGMRLRKGKSGLKGPKASRYMVDRKRERIFI